MASKLLLFVLLAVVVSQGYAQLNQVTLPEEEIFFISHPLYSRVITIPKWWFDTLLTCHVVYPNGVVYEAFPTSNIPDVEIEYQSAAEPFNACSIAFKHSETIDRFSGNYELRSLVNHTNGSMTLTDQRFRVSITRSEVGMP